MLDDIRCGYCGTLFTPEKRTVKYCSSECRRLLAIDKAKAQYRRSQGEPDYTPVSFEMEDPWTSGRLPKSVTRNNIWW